MQRWEEGRGVSVEIKYVSTWKIKSRNKNKKNLSGTYLCMKSFPYRIFRMVEGDDNVSSYSGNQTILREHMHIPNI